MLLLLLLLLLLLVLLCLSRLKAVESSAGVGEKERGGRGRDSMSLRESGRGFIESLHRLRKSRKASLWLREGKVAMSVVFVVVSGLGPIVTASPTTTASVE